MFASALSSGESGEVPFRRQVTSEGLPTTMIAPAGGQPPPHTPSPSRTMAKRSPRLVGKNHTKGIALSPANITNGLAHCEQEFIFALHTRFWRRKRCLISSSKPGN